MATLDVEPPITELPKRRFTLKLSEIEAMHVWAALGNSSSGERTEWLNRTLGRTVPAYNQVEVFVLLNNIFKSKHMTT